MNRFLQILNLLGIGALAVLCAIQWQTNRQLNVRALIQEKIRQEQVAQLAERDKQIQNAAADLDDFRARLTRNQTELSGVQNKLGIASGDRDRLTAERDQLKTIVESQKSSLNQWTAAVASRDQALKQAGEQAQKLAADRNDAVTKFNALAMRYNAAAGEIKEAAENIQKLIADRNDAVAKFNDLATKYDQLIQEANRAATRP